MVLTGLVSAWPLVPAVGQLAITEVMSYPSPSGTVGTDFWELTNFGTNTIDLATYWFRDDGDFSGAVNLASLSEGLRIEPRETIVFAQEQAGVITTPDDFSRWWWGDTTPGLVRIVMYRGFGFSRFRDAVQLWQVTTDRTTLVQRIELFDSVPATTFTYDPATGEFDTFSAAGVNGAFQAATANNIGSPGVTTGSVRLTVVESPSDTEVDAGSPAVFAVRAQGLPKPRYQWRLNGEAIVDATSNTLTLANTTALDAGQYAVELDNGLETVVTPPATLTVNTTPRCATIVRPPEDLVVTPGQTAIFRVEARGYPLPVFRWQFNGVDIPGATSSTYSAPDVDESRGGIYTVHVTNPLCSTNASARLSVVPPPNLIITEAMANPSLNTAVPGHNDWWELTNVGTNAVNLRGYRFDDAPGNINGGITVTNNVVVQPGRSVIFVSSMTPDSFRRWWGEENLPCGLPIIAYPGNGFSAFGDLARLWNATALTDDDWVVSKSFVNLEPGVSLWFDSDSCEFGCPNVEGERGTFRAAESDDIGSPGWTSNAERVVRPRFTSIRRDAARVTLTWKTQPGQTYEVQYRDHFGGPDWTILVRLPADGESLTTVDSTAGSAPQRFYRVVLLPVTP